MSRHRRQASRVLPQADLNVFDSPPSDPCFLMDQITAVDKQQNNNHHRQSPPTSSDHHQNATNSPPSDAVNQKPPPRKSTA
ncbi:Serine/threonine-protein kinase AGC1-7 [Bienertia sinuspersici]